MFNIKEIQYEELSSIKKDYKLEIVLYLYKDTEDGIKIFQILNEEKFVGIILARGYSDGVLIEYFEILKDERNKKLGRKFISYFIKELKIKIYVSPLPERVKFWENCGFETSDNIFPMLCHK